MTTAEALAVVRGVIMGYQDVISLPDVDRALAALVLIETTMWGSDADYWHDLYRKAEAERDEARRRFSLEELERLERRVAELEAALWEGGCQFYIDGDIGACQKHQEADPCPSCRALGGGE